MGMGTKSEHTTRTWEEAARAIRSRDVEVERALLRIFCVLRPDPAGPDVDRVQRESHLTSCPIPDERIIIDGVQAWELTWVEERHLVWTMRTRWLVDIERFAPMAVTQ